MAVDFQTIESRRAEELFTALPKEPKWAQVVNTLLLGKSIFIPGMDRNALETVRSIVNHRGYGRLRSRSTEVDGVPGKLLRLQRLGGA